MLTYVLVYPSLQFAKTLIQKVTRDCNLVALSLIVRADK